MISLGIGEISVSPSEGFVDIIAGAEYMSGPSSKVSGASSSPTSADGIPVSVMIFCSGDLHRVDKRKTRMKILLMYMLPPHNILLILKYPAKNILCIAALLNGLPYDNASVY